MHFVSEVNRHACRKVFLVLETLKKPDEKPSIATSTFGNKADSRLFADCPIVALVTAAYRLGGAATPDP
jgi:hypothetical protein